MSYNGNATKKGLAGPLARGRWAEILWVAQIERKRCGACQEDKGASFVVGEGWWVVAAVTWLMASSSPSHLFSLLLANASYT